jgi:hypothetical protein
MPDKADTRGEHVEKIALVNSLALDNGNTDLDVFRNGRGGSREKPQNIAAS